MPEKTRIRVYADPYLSWMFDDRDSRSDLACEVMNKLGTGRTFNINYIKIGFIPSKFINNPLVIEIKDRTEIDDGDFEFIPDEHEDNYEIEWIFGDS